MRFHQLIDLHHFAVQSVEKYSRKRFLFSQLTAEKGKHFLGIIGPRGVGKTVLLRQYAATHSDAFYLSADTLGPGDDPWQLIVNLNEKLGFGTFLIDEIHFLENPTALLKRLYDFLDVRVLFTSSVALAMEASRHDLSRRARVRTLHPFSYREYLAFSQAKELPPLTLEALAAHQWTPQHVRNGNRFDEYLTGGQLPYAREEPDPFPLLQNILDEVVGRDLPSVARLAVDELDIIKRLLLFIGRSPVDGINYSSLSRNLSITKYKAAQYVASLEKAFVLRQVFPAGTNVLREPKVLMCPPYRLLYRDYDDCIGGLREDSLCQCLAQAGIDFHYLKTTRGAKTPDFLIQGPKKLVIEVEGKGKKKKKGRRKFKGIQAKHKLVAAHIDAPQNERIPLFMFGYLSGACEQGA
jgi:predicted AAA+ superfamily ATPase